MTNFLLKLSENEKRIIIVVLLLLILVLYLLGVIYAQLKRFMARQGADIGRLMATQVEAGFISSLGQFKRNSYRKSRLEFYKGFSITFLGMLLWFAIYGTVSLFYRHWLNLFDQNIEGVTTLVYTFDFASASRATFFGINLINDWPPVLHKATFSVRAIPSYILFFFGVALITLFIIQVLSYLSRTIFIIEHSKKMFTRDLKNYKLDDISAAPASLQEEGINTPEKPVITTK